MAYIDANVFVVAALDQKEKGEAARRLIRNPGAFGFTACSSVLAIDEMIWAVARRRSRAEAVRYAKGLLATPKINFLGLDNQVMHLGIDVIEAETLDPRDSLHLGTMRSRGISVIISEDRDFDRVKGVKRLSVAEAARL